MNDRRKIYFILWLSFFIHLLCFSLLFIISLYRLDYTVLPTNMIYRLFSFICPIILWLLSTNIDDFNYYRTKKATYTALMFHEALLFASIMFELLSLLFLPALLDIKTDEIFTKGMVLFLARIIIEVPVLLLILLLMYSLLRPIRSEKSSIDILGFKLSHYQQQKLSSKIEYPLSIAKDISTGKDIVISEKDRFLHTLVDGTSGTGKTSSTILPAIKNDLNARCQAVLKQKELYKKIKQKEKENPEYDASDDLFRLRQNYPACGITVLAPEDSLTDDVCSLCEARNIPYHRIDATRNIDGEIKKGWTGMNPFYISPGLTEDVLQMAIVKKAVVFSDVMQVITDLKGKADSYFTGLNRQMISNLAILVMYTVPLLHKRQATPLDLQLLINNFDLLPPYVSKFEEIDREKKRYTFIVQYIRDELLGKGRPKMEDQSRGTRNIINEFLLMPGSREVYCTQDSIDFDRILENGEVTVCNYDLASGDSNAVAFGLFFLLSFNNAVLSRPGTERTRIPHFFYIDELPVLIHSSLEKNFSLFRKFRVAMFCAIQTLDQFEKNEITKYLKGVILGCAHIFIFGRSSLSDMEVFSQMAGIREDTEEQTTVSQTALSSESPFLSYSTRELASEKNNLEEIDIRMRDFQEITLFTTRDGRPLPPIHAKVNFLKESDWKKKTGESFPYGQYTEQSAPLHTEIVTEPQSHHTFVLKPVSELRVKEAMPTQNQTEENARETPDAKDMKSPSPIPDGSESLDGIF